MSWRAGPAVFRDLALPFITNLQPQCPSTAGTVWSADSISLVVRPSSQSDRYWWVKMMINPVFPGTGADFNERVAFF